FQPLLTRGLLTPYSKQSVFAFQNTHRNSFFQLSNDFLICVNKNIPRDNLVKHWEFLIKHWENLVKYWDNLIKHWFILVKHKDIFVLHWDIFI
ncbi:MAG TPA: hypothetical protein PKY59_17255, partial [Pyrinomonadaceae bacterium]|nr:hypothetical protein [Pyrinomonadaceae bacterium]